MEQQDGTQEGDRNLRHGGKQAKVEKNKNKKKIEMGKKYGNAHSNSTAKHGSRAPPPMTVLAGCRGRHHATQGKA